MTQSYKYYAGGAWREAEGAQTFEVLEPYSRQPFARVAAGGRAEARIAVEAAAGAFPEWSIRRRPNARACS